METAAQQQKIAPEFIKTIDGKDFVLYAGLLDLAHKKGINQIDIVPVQLPKEENQWTAVIKATVYGKDGQVFVEIGDANPSNCNRKVALHIIRMAATRAKARAFRDYTNIGMTCLEELGENDELPAGQSSRTTQPPKQERPRQDARTEDKPQGERKYDSPPPPMSDAQRRAILNLGRRIGLSEDEVNEKVVQHFGKDFNKLNIKEASTMIGVLQKEAA